MRIVLLSAILALTPAAAFAQAVDTSAGGAYSGTYSGSANTAAGGGFDASVNTSADRPVDQSPFGGSASEPPRDVRNYIEANPSAPAVGGGALGVGDAVPSGANVRPVPGYPQWGYSSNAGQNIIVNRDTGTVAATMGDK